MFSKLRHVVNKMFTKHLLVTNTAIGCLSMTAGDVAQQFLEKKIIQEKDYDPKRTRNMAAGGLCFGYLGHLWYKMLDRKFPGANTGSVVRKLGAEMALGPPLVLGTFITVGYFKDQTLRQSFQDFKDNLVMVLAMDWAFYVPMQTLNFYLVPPSYRLLYVSVINLAYDMFLSYVINKFLTCGSFG
ncbi:MPV17L2 [Cordylochernes scorpioides]|uniref:MPV17L2 n=1 Tax=Cordylochernes scorpioides TaxID=51811 RepID=A0ABY6LIF4_9ARAC|nr:MPV17L2 [Cordylochernes scorpioides]